MIKTRELLNEFKYAYSEVHPCIFSWLLISLKLDINLILGQFSVLLYAIIYEDSVILIVQLAQHKLSYSQLIKEGVYM